MDNGTGKTHCEGKPGRREKKKQRPSSEMLKRKRTKESGSHALIPEERSKREAPVERLWERSWEGRKETNRKLSTGIGRKAWKQARRKKKATGTQETVAHRRNRCQGKTGSRDKKEQKAE